MTPKRFYQVLDENDHLHAVYDDKDVATKFAATLQKHHPTKLRVVMAKPKEEKI